mmetsp:Transcript_24717/g.67495  ORF Transcript_24717/g.67495 Transcript_24717/m.67495 type:complete len:271 (+) Transcript_24717:1298-2110(+)
MSKWLAFNLVSGIFSTKPRNASMLTSALPPLSSLKRSSALRPAARKCARNAAMMASCASTAARFLAERRCTSCFLHFESRAPVLTFCLTSVLRASLKGPLVAFFMESMCSLIRACALSIDSTTVLRTFIASSMALRGLSCSVVLLATSASALALALSASSVQSFTSCSISAVMASAAFLSAASCLLLLSFSMHCFIFLSDSETFFWSWEWEYCTLLTLGLIFTNSLLVSANGPDRTLFSSSVFWSMYLEHSLALSAKSCNTCSIFFTSAL